MGIKTLSWKTVILLVTMSASGVSAVSRVGVHDYTAASDAVSGKTLLVGQKVVHMGYELQLREVVTQVPIFAVQYSGLHYRETPADAVDHAEARAKSVAERIVHAWTLMDHGARIEVADDDWNVFRSESKTSPTRHMAVYVRSPVAGAEPLRILTVYPEDIAAYPWISSEKSLADYLAALIEAQYRLFSRNETDLSKYRASPLDKTREGRIFTEIATQASEAAQRST